MVFSTTEHLPAPQPTIWGLTPTQLHDHYWAARGVQVVRLGERSPIVHGAELFLLTEPHSLVLFRLRGLLERFTWMKPDLLVVRVHCQRNRDYREVVITGDDDRVLRFKREYLGGSAPVTRVALTGDPDIARSWQAGVSTKRAWSQLRHQTPRFQRDTAEIGAITCDRTNSAEVAQFVRHLVAFWSHPAATVGRAHKHPTGAWRDPTSRIDPDVRVIGPIWIGAGRDLASSTPVVGPAVLWDDQAQRPLVDDIEWLEIEHTDAVLQQARPRQVSSPGKMGKRIFDLLFSLLALLVLWPIFPLMMLAIYLEDGRPFFYGQFRETLSGREFVCWKFRSMRKDADRVKQQIKSENQADGPQFFMEDDPRLTRIGKFIRKANIDEFPQFWNVLKGDMSIVGPRPSPRAENQFCPAWREARLSVRPGITGLWQVKRTRRKGLDFQEWIKFDIQYVEQHSMWLDVRILWDTVVVVLRGALRS